MKILLFTILAGILGASVRVIFLELISHLRPVHMDMIKAIGTLYHGSFKHALLRGIAAHYFFGILSAFFYLLLISFFEPSSIISSAAFGGLIGLYNGYAVSFSLIVLVAENHPIPEFREYGHEPVIYHWIAQVLYGIIVGTVVGAWHLKIF